MENLDLELLYYPALVLVAFVVIYNIVHLIVRYSSRVIGAIVAIPLGLYAAKVVSERLHWQIDFGQYADWLSNIIT